MCKVVFVVVFQYETNRKQCLNSSKCTYLYIYSVLKYNVTIMCCGCVWSEILMCFRCVWAGWKVCQRVRDHMASTLSQLQFGRLRGLRAKVLHRYEHRPFVSCLSGLYGCRWRRYERSCTQPGDCCCNKVRPPSHTWSSPRSCLLVHGCQ